MAKGVRFLERLREICGLILKDSIPTEKDEVRMWRAVLQDGHYLNSYSMNAFGRFGIPSQERPSSLSEQEARQREAVQRLEAIANDYRIFKDHQQNSMLNPDEFEQLFLQIKDGLAQISNPVGAGMTELWAKRNLVNTLFELHNYPEAAEGDSVHATDWRRLVRLIAEGGEILPATASNYGTGIWFTAKSEQGKISAQDLGYGKGDAYGKENFPVAVRIPKGVINFLREKEMRTESKIVVENAGNIEGEGYISAAQGQGLPLLFLEIGLPDGKWHTLADIRDVHEVRVAAREHRLKELT